MTTDMRTFKDLLDKFNTFSPDNPDWLLSIMSVLKTEYLPGKLPKSFIRFLVYKATKRLSNYEGLKLLMEFVLTGDGTILRNLGFFSTPASGKGFGDDSKASKDDTDLNGGPFKRIPNVRSFKVELQPYDPLFALFNIRKRFSPNFHFHKYANGRLNRYILHQLVRANKALENNNNELYGRIASGSIRRSICFFLVQLQDTELNGHRQYSIYLVKRWYKEYRAIAVNLRSDVKYKRVFIPKGVSKLRPLGVPSHPGRIYLGLVNKFTQIYLKPKLNKDQHAYMHGKGVLTAWESIFKDKVLDARDIGEFDLKSFFPSVNLIRVSEELRHKQVPQFISNLMFNLCSRLPSNLYEGFEDEVKFVESLPKDKQERLGLELKHGGPFKDITDALTRGNRKFGRDILYSLKPGSNFEVEVDFDKILEVREGDHYIKTKMKGVPQGMPLAPLLSLTVLDVAIFQQGLKAKMYADDGFFGGDLPDDSDPGFGKGLSGGVSYAQEKCGWVKRDGVWLKPFKFLGFEYDGNRKLFYANTRNGSKLVYDRFQMVELIRNRELFNSKDISKEVLTTFNGEEVLNLLTPFRTRVRELVFNPSNQLYYGTKEAMFIVTRTIKAGKGGYVVQKFQNDTDSGRAQRNRMHYRSGEALIKSSIYGLVMNRLQIGTGNMEGIEQDFRLKYIKGSGIDRHEKGIQREGLNVFNSTSFALNSLGNILAREVKNRGKLGLDEKLKDVKDIRYPINPTSPYLKLRLDAPQFYTERMAMNG